MKTAATYLARRMLRTQALDHLRLGLQYLGSGSFTTAYSHPNHPGIVFKYNRDGCDDMREYHRWLKRQTHENLPRVYEVISHRDSTVAIVEELQELDPFSYDSDTSRYWYEDANAILVDLGLRDMIEGAGFVVNDIRHCNVMMRCGGTMVINDPSTGKEC